MTQPKINFPESYDDDENLYLVHDFLRLVLIKDYKPGDTTVYVNVGTEEFARFPPTGLITLTDQCAPVDERAVTFHYGAKSENGFTDLSLLPGFKDVAKPKQFTNVLQNVMAQHHNNIKDAIVAIEKFCGIRGLVDLVPFGPTLEGRINFLRKLVLSPRAWFTVNKRVGLVPFTVRFQDQSFRLGTDGAGGDIEFKWEFGDHGVSSISAVTVTDTVPEGVVAAGVYDIDGRTVTKTYTKPGIYSPKLTVKNKFGTDSIQFEGMIEARLPAPEPAAIQFIPKSNQILTDGDPAGGPYATPPTLRTPINTFVALEVPEGENAVNTPGYTYAGEKLDGGTPEDPVVQYTWSLADDLLHNNSSEARAMYSVGGLYDVVLRVDTALKAYRITALPDAIDVVENYNLWLWTRIPSTLWTGSLDPGQDQVRAYEYGLISETFKVKATTPLTITQDSSFLPTLSDAESNRRQLYEFMTNVHVAPRATSPSGLGGSAFLFNATGRSALDPVSAEGIQTTEYNGFTDVYLTPYPVISRPWNWVALSSGSNTYFLLGYPTDAILPNTSPTNQEFVKFAHLDGTTASEVWTAANYSGGGQELMQNPATYDPSTGESLYGYFSGYRTTWKDSTGFIIRNEGVGPFFRFKSFYKTEGTIGSTVQSIRKLPDMPGSTKVEGRLVTLSSGIYFFNNSGAVNAYNDTTQTWETSSGSASFRLLQDQTSPTFDSQTNTLLAASDGDKRVYLSYDYSENAFIRFNAADLTFSKLGSRPSGTQWAMSVW